MANSWQSPKLVNPIATDVPDIQKKLEALAKQDPTPISNIPNGAKRLIEISSGKWQLQQFNGTSWVKLGKLQMDVDTVDGFHAAVTPQKNTVAVRNASGKLEDDITGNAGTASSAATLSQTLPVNKGGTGATTSAAARTNLGVPPTSHASTGTAYGVGSDTNYGHVKGDGITTTIQAGKVIAKDVAIGGNVGDCASARGQVGDIAYTSAKSNFDDYISTGVYFITWCSQTPPPLNAPPRGCNGVLVVYSTNPRSITKQIFYNTGTPNISDKSIHSRLWNKNSWGAWHSISVNESNETVTGVKSFTKNIIRQTENYVASDGIPSATQYATLEFKDKNGVRLGGVEFVARTNGDRDVRIFVSKLLSAGDLVSMGIRVAANDNAQTFCPHPPASASGSQITTANWVNSKLAHINTQGITIENSAPLLVCKETDYDRTVLPKSRQDGFIVETKDMHNVRVGGVYKRSDTDGHSSMGIYICPPLATSTSAAGVIAHSKSDGTMWGTAPTAPPASAKSEIVTAEWDRRRHKVSTAVPTASDGVDGDIWYRY